MQHNCNHLKKTKLSVIFMAMIGLLLSGCATECHCGNAFANVGRNISFEQMSKMPPFTATVESIDFDHPFFTSKTSVDLWLLKSDGPECLVAHSYPADKTTVSFVRNLEKGREYVFPQAYLDYVKTNAPIVERE